MSQCVNKSPSVHFIIAVPNSLNMISDECFLWYSKHKHTNTNTEITLFSFNEKQPLCHFHFSPSLHMNQTMCTSSRISLSFYLGSTNVFDEEKKDHAAAVITRMTVVLAWVWKPSWPSVSHIVSVNVAWMTHASSYNDHSVCIYLCSLTSLDETCYINCLGYKEYQHLYNFWELFL